MQLSNYLVFETFFLSFRFRNIDPIPDEVLDVIAKSERSPTEGNVVHNGSNGTTVKVQSKKTLPEKQGNRKTFPDTEVLEEMDENLGSAISP